MYTICKELHRRLAVPDGLLHFSCNTSLFLHTYEYQQHLISLSWNPIGIHCLKHIHRKSKAPWSGYISSAWYLHQIAVWSIQTVLFSQIELLQIHLHPFYKLFHIYQTWSSCKMLLHRSIHLPLHVLVCHWWSLVHSHPWKHK